MRTWDAWSEEPLHKRIDELERENHTLREALREIEERRKQLYNPRYDSYSPKLWADVGEIVAAALAEPEEGKDG